MAVKTRKLFILRDQKDAHFLKQVKKGNLIETGNRLELVISVSTAKIGEFDFGNLQTIWEIEKRPGVLMVNIYYISGEKISLDPRYSRIEYGPFAKKNLQKYRRAISAPREGIIPMEIKENNYKNE